MQPVKVKSPSAISDQEVPHSERLDKKKRQKIRSWSGTLNNYTEAELRRIQEHPDISYAIIGEYIGHAFQAWGSGGAAPGKRVFEGIPQPPGLGGAGPPQEKKEKKGGLGGNPPHSGAKRLSKGLGHAFQSTRVSARISAVVFLVKAKMLTINSLLWILDTGKEIGQSGTPHLQISLTLTKAVRMKWMQENMSERAHWEKTIHLKAAMEYCKKDKNFIEVDNRKTKERGKGREEYLSGVWTQLREGQRLKNIMLEEPVKAAEYQHHMERLNFLVPRRRRTKPLVTWIFGPTGTGKSDSILNMLDQGELWEDTYFHNNAAYKWWDGYHGESIIILDELRPAHVPLNELLRQWDCMPLKVERKGGFTYYEPEEVFVTTCKDPRNFYNNIDGSKDEAIDQLARRIDCVMRASCHRNEEGEIIYDLHDETELYKCGKFFVKC